MELDGDNWKRGYGKEQWVWITVTITFTIGIFISILINVIMAWIAESLGFGDSRSQIYFELCVWGFGFGGLSVKFWLRRGLRAIDPSSSNVCVSIREQNVESQTYGHKAE